MEKIIENSIFLSFVVAFFKKISEKWNESQTGWMITRNLNDVKSDNSYVYRLLNYIINKTFSLNIGGIIGEKIKTSVFLNLFSHYEFGIYAMLLLAPIIPTMACVAIVFLTFAMFFINSIVKNEFNIKIDAFTLLTTVFMVILFICSATSYEKIESLKIFAIYFVFISFTFLVIACGTDKKKLKIMVNVFIVSGFFVSMFGIYQNFFGNNIGHAWLDEDMFEDITVRVYSTLGNPNVLGEYLLLIIPICGAMLYSSKRLLVKFIYFSVMCCSILCMIYTQSRGCWLGLILAAVIFAFFIDKRLLILCIIGALLLPFVLPDSIINRFMSIGNLGDSSTSYRVFIWLGTLRMLKDIWLTGIGIGEKTFNNVYPHYAYTAIIAPHSHNLYLQIFVETGICGIVTFFATILLSLKKILVGYIVGKKSVYGILCGAVIAGLLGFLLQGMFDYVWYNYRVFAIFWMFIGIGIASRRCACEEDNTRNK